MLAVARVIIPPLIRLRVIPYIQRLQGEESIPPLMIIDYRYQALNMQRFSQNLPKLRHRLESFSEPFRPNN
jgi:hypothetical protein